MARAVWWAGSRDAAGFEVKRTSFLSGMEPGARRALMARGRRRLYEKGEVVFAQGDAGATMLMIETGRVQVSTVSESGQQVLLGHLGAGDVVGEMALLDGSPRSATVVASGPVTGSLVTFADFEAFLVAEPKVLFGLTIELARKLKAANALAENRALDDGRVRLARCLLDLAERWGEPAADGGIRIREVFPQGTIGLMSNLSRESVNRALRAWAREGLVATEDGHLKLLAPDALKRIADDG